MININHTQVFGWEAAIRGMRNPMNSWNKSDSTPCRFPDECLVACHKKQCEGGDHFFIGPNDHDLMMRLVKAGDEHAKFMRMIHVSMDILAPLYWWKQADTYKVGFVTNSCSTMHKIHAKEFVLDDFSHEHVLRDNSVTVNYVKNDFRILNNLQWLMCTIDLLNAMREAYLETKDKDFWWQLIQLLPDSYNQLRTCDTNYATLRKMYHQRKGHKLDEWNDFRAWVEELPYSKLIVGNPSRKRDTFADALEEYMANHKEHR